MANRSLRGDKTVVSIPSGGQHGTLVANTTKSIVISGDPVAIEVMNRGGSADIFFSVQTLSSAASPTLSGTGTFVVPAVVGATKIVNVPDTDTDVRVLLLSSGTPTYSVTGVYR